MNFPKPIFELIGDYVCIGISKFIFKDICPESMLIEMKHHNNDDVACKIILYYMQFNLKPKQDAELICKVLKINNKYIEISDDCHYTFISAIQMLRYKNIYDSCNPVMWIAKLAAQSGDPRIMNLINNDIGNLEEDDIMDIITDASIYGSVFIIIWLMKEYYNLHRNEWKFLKHIDNFEMKIGNIINMKGDEFVTETWNEQIKYSNSFNLRTLISKGESYYEELDTREEIRQ